MSRRDHEKKGGIPPLDVTKESVEDVVRILKAGIRNTFECSDATKEQLGMWITEREDEINREEGRDSEAMKNASPPIVDIKGQLVAAEEETPDVHEGADTIIENPPLDAMASIDANAEHWENRVQESGSGEQASRDKERDDWALNPPPHLRGGNP